jgi:hypothetical protein
MSLLGIFVVFVLGLLSPIFLGMIFSVTQKNYPKFEHKSTFEIETKNGDKIIGALPSFRDHIRVMIGNKPIFVNPNDIRNIKVVNSANKSK